MLEFCLNQPDEAAAGLRMACDLWLYWESRGHLTEGRRFIDALTGQAGAGMLRARGMWVAGYLALVQGDAGAARRWLEDALMAGQSLGAAEAVAYASQFLGRALWFTGETPRGTELTEEALGRHRTSRRLAGRGADAGAAWCHADSHGPAGNSGGLAGGVRGPMSGAR